MPVSTARARDANREENTNHLWNPRSRFRRAGVPGPLAAQIENTLLAEVRNFGLPYFSPEPIARITRDQNQPWGKNTWGAGGACKRKPWQAPTLFVEVANL